MNSSTITTSTGSLGLSRSPAQITLPSCTEHVILIAAEEGVRLQSVVHAVYKLEVVGVIKVIHAEECLGPADTFVGKHGAAGLLVDLDNLFRRGSVFAKAAARSCTSAEPSDAPLIIRGVRASSIRMLSTSSTMQ